MRFLQALIIAFALQCSISFATSGTLQNLYINPQKQSLPEAIIFYNSANTCENCPQTINMLIGILEKNYRHKLHAYLIDVQKRPEFIGAFHLSGPLNLVIIRISDGGSFGYEKMSGLQSRINNPQNFSRTITEFINNFLNF